MKCTNRNFDFELNLQIYLQKKTQNHENTKT